MENDMKIDIFSNKQTNKQASKKDVRCTRTKEEEEGDLPYTCLKNKMIFLFFFLFYIFGILFYSVGIPLSIYNTHFFIPYIYLHSYVTIKIE